jgi:hypothetical protein
MDRSRRWARRTGDRRTGDSLTPARLLALGALLAPLVGAPRPVVAEVFKWVDERGRVHYGDRAPAQGNAAERLDLRAAPSADSAPGSGDRPELGRLLRAFEMDRERRAEAARSARAAQAQRRQQCAQATERLARFGRANVVFSRDGQGERRYLDDAQRATVMEQLREEADRLCR